MIHSVEDYEREPFLACSDIQNYLTSSQLILFLGAGASAGFGLPRWYDLVRKVTGSTETDEELAKKSDQELSRMIDEVDDGSREYFRKIHSALYEGLPDDFLKILTQSPLLLSIAALLIGSSRGRINTVFTSNYDDILEQYLRILGCSLNVRLDTSQLSDGSKLEINHIHGFLPRDWPESGCDDELPEIILSESSYRDRRTEIDNGWSSYVTNSLKTKVALIVGMSGDDSAVLDVFMRAKKDITRRDLYLGYWLLTPGSYEKNQKQIQNVGMCPLKIEKDQIPNFIFKICQSE